MTEVSPLAPLQVAECLSIQALHAVLVFAGEKNPAAQGVHTSIAKPATLLLEIKP